MNNRVGKIMNDISPAWGTCLFENKNLLDCRAAMRLPQGTKSVIVALFPYCLESNEYEGQNISSYAVVKDYHMVLTVRLKKAVEELKKEFPNESFEQFADNSPFPEVEIAVKAGLGVRGKNGLLINNKFGSWVFIGEIATTLSLQSKANIFCECINCGKCIAVCPTGALSEKGVDKSRCLSDITQRKGELTSEQKKLIVETGTAWGCDICQKICPMNNEAKPLAIEEFKDGAKSIAQIGDDLSDRAYAWRGRDVIERNLRLFKDETSE